MSDISIKSTISSSLFVDNYEYPNWFNKKKFIFYNKILKRLQRLSYLHSRASQYYENMNFRIFAPSITITALSGIASFLSTSQYVSESAQNGFGIGVGIVASISSVLQSLAGACQYSAKKEAHRTVAEQYNNLIISVKFEIEMPNEENFTDKLEVQILDIQSKCNYFVPQFIVEEYDKKHAIKVSNKSNTIELNNDNVHKSNENIVINIDDKNYDTFNELNNQFTEESEVNEEVEVNNDSEVNNVSEVNNDSDNLENNGNDNSEHSSIV